MLKILIAEDEEPIANLIKMNLRKAGYHCIWEIRPFAAGRNASGNKRI